MEGLIKTSETPVFSDSQTMPAEAGIRRLKTTIDTLCVPATPTRCTVTGAKWTPATYAQMVLDMNISNTVMKRKRS